MLIDTRPISREILSYSLVDATGQSFCVSLASGIALSKGVKYLQRFTNERLCLLLIRFKLLYGTKIRRVSVKVYLAKT